MERVRISEAAAPYVEVETLVPWLDANVPALGDGPLQADFLSGGSSNIVLKLDRGGTPVVLRRSPPVGPPGGEKTIAREARILGGLKGSDVPHPVFHGFTDDPAVNGAPFYIMDLIDGWAATVTPETTIFPDGFDRGPDHHYVGWAMCDGLIKMAQFDYKASSLADFGNPDGFVARQVDRWLSALNKYPSQYVNYEKRDLPGLDYVAAWLRANLPASSTPGLIHADYSVNNVLFANHPPSRLLAIVDWETATIGDPLLDLAGFCRNLRDERWLGEDEGSYFENSGFPTRQAVFRHYARETGRDVSAIDYYMVLYAFRAACMIEYKVAESAAGLSSPEKGQRFAREVEKLVFRAERLARRIG